MTGNLLSLPNLHSPSCAHERSGKAVQNISRMILGRRSLNSHLDQTSSQSTQKSGLHFGSHLHLALCHFSPPLAFNLYPHTSPLQIFQLQAQLEAHHSPCSGCINIMVVAWCLHFLEEPDLLDGDSALCQGGRFLALSV